MQYLDAKQPQKAEPPIVIFVFLFFFFFKVSHEQSEKQESSLWGPISPVVPAAGSRWALLGKV